jgi:dTDP-4-amino-4,6-dideoxygalactose transaminase
MTALFPFFDLTRQYKQLKPQIMATVERVFDKQGFVMGDEVTNFEKEIAQFLNVKHAVTCSSGTDALVLGLKTLGVRPGDEVLTVPFSFFASTSAILLIEAKPVFVDIEPTTFNMDPTLLERALTKNTKAILPVHLFGQCAEMEGILSFAKKHGLPILEDAAQSVGAKYYDRYACSMGEMGATSFYPTKNLGGAGEGGLVTTNDDALADKAKLLRVHGMRVRYTHDVLGWNSRMDALQAAVLRVKLPHLSNWVKRRTDLAERYARGLQGLEQKGFIVLPKTLRGRFHVWNQYTVLVKNRDVVRAHLEEKGIPTDIFYPKTIPAQPVMKELGYTEAGFPISVQSAAEALSLPIFPELTNEEQDQVINGLVAILA